MNQMLHRFLPSRPYRHTLRLGWLGVDVGSCAVKIAQVEKREVGWGVRRASITPVPIGADPIETAAEAIALNVPKRPRCFERPAACIAPHATELHNVEVPSDSDRQSLNSIVGSTDVPFDKNSVALWRSSCAAKEQGNQPCHLVSFNQRHAALLAEHFLKSRAECQVLDCLPFALARAATLAGDASREPVAMIDCAAAHPCFSIVRDGRPFFTRMFRECGFQSMYNAIGERLGLDYCEVQRLLSEFERSEASSSSCRHTLRFVQDVAGLSRDRFLSEVDRTIRFVKTEESQLTPHRICLLGGGATFPGLSREVRELTGIPTTVWKLHSAAKTAAGGLPQDMHAYAVALSLSAIPLLN